MGKIEKKIKQEFDLELLLVFTIFSSELTNVVIAGSWINSFQLLLALYGFTKIRNTVSVFHIFSVWTFIFIGSYLLLLFFEYDPTIFYKQTLPILFVYCGIGSLIGRASIERLTVWYVRLSIASALFGILQYTLGLLGLNVLLKVPGTLDSVAFEPSHYSLVVAPACWFLLSRHSTYPIWCTVVVILGLFLTKSLTGFLLIPVCLLFAGTHPRFLFYYMLIGGILAILYYNQSMLPDRVETRIKDMESTKFGYSAGSDNLSVLSFGTNLEVAINTLKSGRLFGNGFGGHPSAYEEMFEHVSFKDEKHYGMNMNFGHCLGTRLISEFGFLGLLVMLFWIVKAFRSSRSTDYLDIWWTLSGIYLIGRCTKCGGYLEYGAPLFFLVPLLMWKTRSQRHRGIRRV